MLCEEAGTQHPAIDASGPQQAGEGLSQTSAIAVVVTNGSCWGQCSDMDEILFAEGSDPGLREMPCLSLMAATLISLGKTSNMCIARSPRTQTDGLSSWQCGCRPKSKI